MATSYTNKSNIDLKQIPSVKGKHVGIVVAQWHTEITNELLAGCKQVLMDKDVSETDIHIVEVPGSFELLNGARLIASQQKLDAVICLGCIIKGETAHFEFIAQAVSTGIAMLNIQHDIPFIFGVLTPDNIEQARERAGGSHGHKGKDAAISAIQMMALKSPRKDIGYKS